MKKTKHAMFVLLSSIFIILIIFSTWLYMSIYQHETKKRPTAQQSLTQAEKQSMIDSIQTASTSTLSYEDRLKMMESISNNK